jgi:hypothetical protein
LTVERILSTAEQREAPSHQGPFTANEVSNLSRLCSLQSSKRQGISSDDLGFADVDPDMTGQLVEYLEKHVALASGLDLIRESFAHIQRIKNKETKFTMDVVSFPRNFRFSFRGNVKSHL